MAGLEAFQKMVTPRSPTIVGQKPYELSGGALRASTTETLVPSRAMDVRESAANVSTQRRAGPDPLMLAVQLVGGPRFSASVRGHHGSQVGGLKELLPSERGPLGPGVYLSPHENVAQRYAGPGGKMYSANVDEVFHGGGSGRLDSSVNPYDVWREQGARLLKAVDAGKRPQVAALLEKMSPNDGYPFFHGVSQIYGGKTEAQKVFRDAGFKGISGLIDGPEIVYFNKLKVSAD